MRRQNGHIQTYHKKKEKKLCQYPHNCCTSFPSVKGQLCCPHFFLYFSPHFFPYFSPQLFPYFSIYYSIQLAYIIWHIIVYMYRARIMQEFICFYLLSMYSIIVKSIYNIQNSRPRYSAIHTIFWHHQHLMKILMEKYIIHLGMC